MFDDIIDPLIPKYQKYECLLSVELNKLHIPTNRVYIKDHLLNALTRALGRLAGLLVTNNSPTTPGLVEFDDVIGHCKSFTTYPIMLGQQANVVSVQVYSRVDLTGLELFPNGMGTIQLVTNQRIPGKPLIKKSFSEITKDFTISSLSIAKNN